MKKYIILASVLLAGFFSACDYNDRNFDGLEDISRPSNLISEKHTVQSSDISVIVSALKANGKEDIANILNTDKMFSEAAPASDLVPYLLVSKFKSVDLKSTVDVTYNFKEGRSETVTGLSTPRYVISAEDYRMVWGDPYTESFTPNKSPEKHIPIILLSRFADAAKGTFKNVEYYFSNEEPEASIVEGQTIASEDFEGLTASSSAPLQLDGWLNVDLKGSVSWQCRVYSNNNYAQVSSYKSGAENDVWLISKQVDLAGFESPKFSFDIVTGNFNGNGLRILVSANFDGNQSNINSANWEDVTSSFSIPEPASGYSTWATAGKASLSKYEGKKVYVAFRYLGNDSANGTKITTTYQIDNFKVFEEIAGIDVKEKSLQYAAYQFDGEKWAKAGSDIITLQPEDYETMGINYLSTADASHFLPIWLNATFPFAKSGTTKIVVYKSNSTGSYYADELSLDGDLNTWVINSFVVEKTEQFIFAEKGWMFDPTIVVNMQDPITGKAEYQVVVDFVRANQAVENPALSIYADSEYYYGFSARYPNVSYRDKDRSADPLYPINGTSEEKEAFCNARTIEGLQLYLKLRYPNAQPTVNGVVQMAEIDIKIYSSHVHNYDNEIWTYTLECTGDKEWKFIQRVSENGTIEKAE